MTYIKGHSDQEAAQGFVVRPPRVTDAIGDALRQAFAPCGSYDGLPPTLSHTLAKLDQVDR